ncbi:MAG: hypothetical protein ACXWQO_12995 [Bdellovibrionota bacterium]
MKRAVGLVFGLVAIGALIDRARLARKAHLGAKKMVPDFVGNYDIDGVSYDENSKKVIVGSDGRVKEPTHKSVAHQVDIAAKLEEASA